MSAIHRDYWIPERSLYSENRKGDAVPKQPAFDWGVGVTLQALNAASAVDSYYRGPLQTYIASTREYWNTAGPVPGYDVLPMPKAVDRYYDDNEWMVLALAEAAERLHSSKYFDYAQETFSFVESGLDEKLGGGVYWRETQKTSKNTCSNGPAAAAALALYVQNKQPSNLSTARSIYDWTRANLRDPNDGLYYDNIALNGKVQKTKWSYNSGLMLRSAVDLYRFTGEEKYATDAREIQDSSIRHWVGSDGTLKDDGKFIHLLLENWFRAYQYVPHTIDPLPAVTLGLRWLHAKSRDGKGRYGNRWDRPVPSQGYETTNLIDQASVARAYLMTYLETERRRTDKGSKT